MVNIVKASPKIGAEIQGVNVKSMDEATFRFVYLLRGVRCTA